MITDKIKALFQFIEFLHSNIENFKQFDNTINELFLLAKERKKVSPRLNFKDKLKYDKVQAEIKDKFKVIQDSIITQIQAKGTELNICDLNNPETLLNLNISEIRNLKENFSKDDIPEILKHKSKYLEFRTKTNCTYFQDFFFSYLDEILKVLFDFFKDSSENEFETFETKTIQVNGFCEVADQFQKGNKKVSFPIEDLLKPSNVQHTEKEGFPPQPKTKQKKTLSDLITHQNSVQIVEKITIKYKNIKGKRLKLLLLAFQDLELLSKERIAQKFHDCCKNEFDWDIASYNAMNGYVFNEKTDSVEFNSMKQYIETLTKTN